MPSKRVNHKTLSAALDTPEHGVPTPHRGVPTSAITQIAALAVGESWSRVRRGDDTMSLEEFARDSGVMRDEMRAAVNSSVRHAKDKTGGTYTIETGDFISTGRAIYLVCIVTRVA